MKESWIDALKGIGICMVVMPHCELYKLPNKFGMLCSFGQYGVGLFFILSAYLSFVSFERYSKNNENKGGKWVLMKLIRLLPLYYLAIILSLCIGNSSYWLGSEIVVSFWNVLSHAFFVHGLFPHYCNSIIGVEWYIGVLALFYLLVPLLYRFVDSFGKSLMCFTIFAFIASIVSAKLLHYVYGSVTDYYVYAAFWRKFSLLSELPVLMLGNCFFHLRKKMRIVDSDKRHLSLSLLFWGFLMLLGQSLDKNQLFHLSIVLLVGIWFFLVVLGLSIYDFRIVDNVFFRFLGKYSYPIFLFHYPIFLMYNSLFCKPIISVGGLLLRYLVVMAFSAIVSVLLDRFIDKPIQLWMKSKICE